MLTITNPEIWQLGRIWSLSGDTRFWYFVMFNGQHIKYHKASLLNGKIPEIKVIPKIVFREVQDNNKNLVICENPTQIGHAMNYVLAQNNINLLFS